MSGADPRARYPWCTTCQHTHIPTIPTTTYECWDCGWAQWRKVDADTHKVACPGHRTYPVKHALIPATG